MTPAPSRGPGLHLVVLAFLSSSLIGCAAGDSDPAVADAVAEAGAPGSADAGSGGSDAGKPFESSGATPPAGNAARAPGPEIVREIADELHARATSGEFSGAVLVAWNGSPIFRQAFGYADRADSVPNAPDTRFNVGSINKLFTSIAVAQLAARGKLAISDPISRHLPDYPKPVADQVTIEHLLTHASGMGDVFNPRFEARKERLRAPRDYFPLFENEPLAFAPGRGRLYSNAGFIVLGAIVETASGEEYATYVRENVFAPAGMTRTDFSQKDEDALDRAVGYTRWSSRSRGRSRARVENVFYLPARGSSAGGAYSTVGDLLAFTNALLASKLLDPAATRRLFEGGLPSGEAVLGEAAAPGGQGWRSGRLAVAGGAPGINAVLDIDAATGTTVIALSNFDPPAAESIAKLIRARIVGEGEGKRARGKNDARPRARASRRGAR